MNANERRCLHLCLCAMAFIGGPCVLAADWPQFLGPNRNATSTETGLLLTWPKDGPPKVWDKDVGEGFAGPVIAGDRLILFHRIEDKEVVECLDTATGKGRWKFDYPTEYRDNYGKGDGPRSTPLIAGNRVYTLGPQGKLHCLDFETGKKIWDRSINADYRVEKGFFGVSTSPIMEGNRLLINVGGRGAGIVAFDKETGKELWKATDDAPSYASPIAATIDGVRHVIFFTRAGVVSVDPETGTVRFKKPWRSRIDASVNAATPVIAGDLLFVSAEYGTGALVLKVKKDSAEEVWKAGQLLSNHYNTSIAHDGFLYGIDGREEGGAAQLRCIDLKTGKARWGKERFGCASLILAEGHLIALCEDGDLVLVEASPEAYREKARASVLTAGPCRAELALANGKLYGRDNKRLVCWNIKK